MSEIRMLEARIKCPKCGCDITVRSESISTVSPDKVSKILKAAHETMEAVEKGLNRIFHPSLWK